MPAEPAVDNIFDRAAPARRAVSLTGVILGVNVAMFLLTTWLGPPGTADRGDRLLAWGANFGPLTLSTQPWRLLTSNYLHFSLGHLLTNMLCLWGFGRRFWGLGRQTEFLFPKLDFFLLYTFSGIAGSLLGVYAHPLGVGGGASGAVFGLAGALLTTLRWGSLPLHEEDRRQAYKAVVEFAGLNLLGGLALGVFLPIDNFAHMGGFLTGAIAGLALGKRLDPSAESRRFRGIVWLGLTLALIGAGATVFKARANIVPLYRAGELLKGGKADQALTALATYTRQYPEEPTGHLLSARAYLVRGQYLAAADAMQKAIDLAPGDENLLAQQAFAYEHAGRYAAAEVVRRRLLGSNTQDLGRYLALAENQLAQYKVDEAEKTMEAAANLHGRGFLKQPALHLMLARIAFEREDYRKTVEELESARKLGAPAQLVLPALWQVYTAMGDTAKADAVRAEMEKSAPRRK